MVYNGKLYNVAAVVYDGEILGIVPKSYIPNYSEFYEARHFVSGKGVEGYVSFEVTKDEWSLEENCKEGFDYKIYMIQRMAKLILNIIRMTLMKTTGKMMKKMMKIGMMIMMMKSHLEQTYFLTV